MTAGSVRFGSPGVCRVPYRRKPSRFKNEIASTVGIDLLQPFERCGLQSFGASVELPDLAPEGLLVDSGETSLGIGARKRLQVIAIFLLFVGGDLHDEDRSVVNPLLAWRKQGRDGARLEQCLADLIAVHVDAFAVAQTFLEAFAIVGHAAVDGQLSGEIRA